MGAERDPEQERGADTKTGGSLLSDDKFYRALASLERRRLLAYLLEEEETTCDELAAMLVGWKTGETGGMGDTEDYETVVTSLHHRHLPILEEASLLEYDNGDVRLTVDEDKARTVLQLSCEGEGVK